MERLPTRDFQGLIEFLMDGYGVGDLDAFARHLMRALPKLVPCYSTSYNEINTRLDRIKTRAAAGACARERAESSFIPG